MTRFIAFLRTFPDLSDIVGGREVRPYELFTSLVNLGNRVDIYTTSETVGSFERPLFVHKTMLKGRYLRIFLFPFLAMLLLVKVRRASNDNLWCVLQVPVGAESLLQGPFLAFLICITCMILDIKICALVHDISPEQQDFILRNRKFNQAFHKKWRRLQLDRMLAYLGEAIMVKFATVVIAPSEGVREHLAEKHSLDGEKLCVLRASANMNLVPKEKAKEIQKEFVVAFVGSLADVDVELLISAVEKAREVDQRIALDIVGRCDTEGFLSVYGNLPWVRYKGSGKYCDFGKAIDGAHALVIPHSSDPYLNITWQLKIPLYLSSGRPTIITRTDEIERFLEPRDVCIICNPVAEEIARWLLNLSSNRELRERLSERAKEFVLKELTWDISVKKIFSHMLATSRSG